MRIVYHENSRIFHLYNESFSYIMMILKSGHLGQLYCGKHIHDREDFSYLLELYQRSMAAWLDGEERVFSLEHIKQEFPSYGMTDFRQPAVEILQENGSRLSDFRYDGHEIRAGKPGLAGLPAAYVEEEGEAETLIIRLKDELTGVRAELYYSIFGDYGALARSVRILNDGDGPVHITKLMSLNLDLPDYDYEWLQFSGAWSRERHVKTRKLEQGIQSIGSMRGHSSHEHNPFLILKRPCAEENQGEVMGFSFVYSGNFLAQAEVDTHGTTRVQMGIHPDWFDWKLEAGEGFQSPEAVFVYSDKGLGAMSSAFHKLYRERLARGFWRDKERPILINNWEATYFNFTEEKVLQLAGAAKDCGIELFVLDDGWFGKRNSEKAGLGDWFPNREKLPEGIAGLAEKIEKLGMKFGLWFEPEMINQDSALYRDHPDWVLGTPGRKSSPGRYQYVLDFSRPEIVDEIYERMAKILGGAKVSYVKWDMNRSITEAYSAALPPDRQGEVFHRYILGVYSLYERLLTAFPKVLFESCASGGARFDAGMLYYAPQAWTSDDTDAVERLKIQYGTSFGYPISSMGSHVSAVPNHQLHRNTPLKTRANVAYFGTFGYELDLTQLKEEELAEIKKQVVFMKKYRKLLQFGDFYRLKSPFEGNEAAWMAVSRDKRTAVVGWYRILNGVNGSYTRVRLRGLLPDMLYKNELTGKEHYGDELMYLGLSTTDGSAGEPVEGIEPCGDYESRIYVLKAVTADDK